MIKKLLTSFLFILSFYFIKAQTSLSQSGNLVMQVITLPMDVNPLPKGIYILQIISKDQMQSFKFIKK